MKSTAQRLGLATIGSPLKLLSTLAIVLIAASSCKVKRVSNAPKDTFVKFETNVTANGKRCEAENQQENDTGKLYVTRITCYPFEEQRRQCNFRWRQSDGAELSVEHYQGNLQYHLFRTTSYWTYQNQIETRAQAWMDQYCTADYPLTQATGYQKWENRIVLNGKGCDWQDQLDNGKVLASHASCYTPNGLQCNFWWRPSGEALFDIKEYQIESDTTVQREQFDQRATSVSADDKSTVAQRWMVNFCKD